MRKIVIMAGAAMLLAAPAFAEGSSTPIPTEWIGGGSSSSVSSYGHLYSCKRLCWFCQQHRHPEQQFQIL